MALSNITLSGLREEVVNWCDIPSDTSSTHVSTSMLNFWINQAIKKQSSLLSALYEDDYFTSVSTLSTSAGVATVALPDRCARVKGIYWIKDQDDIRLLRRASPDEFVDGGSSPTDPDTWESSPVYALTGQSISFVPVPSAVYSLRIVFVQYPASLSSDLDIWFYGLGWDEWVIADVCMKVMRRKDRDWKPFMEARNDAERLLREAATQRDESGPRMVRRLHGGAMDPRSAFDRATFDD